MRESRGPIRERSTMAAARNARASENELLISLVRAEPSIWDQRSPLYRNADLRWSAWISSELGGAERIVVSHARSEACVSNCRVRQFGAAFGLPDRTSDRMTFSHMCLAL
ncbi:unnamed protein product, partial [Ixodes hexagonus]